MSNSPFTKTYVAYSGLDEKEIDGLLSGKRVGAIPANKLEPLDQLDNMELGTAFEKAVHSVVSHRPWEAVCFTLVHVRGDERVSHRYHFAKCANDVLSHKEAQQVIGQLKKLSGQNKVIAEAQEQGRNLEKEMKDNPTAVAFLRRPFFVLPLSAGISWIPLEPNDRVLDVYSGEPYFSPETPPKTHRRRGTKAGLAKVAA